MANGYFERGEIYWVRMDSGIGFEQGVGRPAVIVSCDKQNNATETVTVAFCSKQPQKSWSIEIGATGCVSYIVGSQITTVDKSRLGKQIGTLNKLEIKKLDELLEEYFDLGYVDDTAIKEKETEIAAKNIQIKELREEIAQLKKQLESCYDEDLSRKVETEMWQRLYEKALEQVCAMKLNGDIALRVEKKIPVSPVEEQPKGTPPVVEDEPGLVDINTAKYDDFKRIGLSSNVILTIINKRPYKSVTELKGLPGMTAIKYNLIEKKICCVVPPKPKQINSALPEPDPGYEVNPTEKVNINTATARELVENLGIKVENKKVNVNLVKTATELTKLTGMCMRTTQGIIKYREENGKFACLEDLLKTPAFGAIAMKRYGHLLEV